MRGAVLFIVLLALAGCGGAAATHYDVGAALQCLQRTNSIRGGGGPESIFLLFASPNGVSAIEPVFVAFGAEKPTGRVAAALGVTRRAPVWTENRGDAHVRGYGPYEPPIAKRQHIPEARARAEGRALDAEVRSALDDCLKKNER